MSLQMHANKNRHHAAQLLSRAASMNKYVPDCEQDNLQGFIHHPVGFPIECKKVWFRKAEKTTEEHPTLGLCFESEKYIRPGTHLQITIPLRGEQQKFSGKVVLVKNLEEGYEIGLWLLTQSDVARIRIVEQICHIETYLKHKHYKEGPFISRERVTEEWITRFASSFPSMAG